jgi:predicted nucleic acid-binding protein
MAATPLPPGLTDTDILVDGQRGVQAAIDFSAHQRASGGLKLSVISAMELIAGCRTRQELTRVQQLLAHVTVIQVSPAVSRRAQDWMETYSLGHGLAIADSLIAATAVESNLPLYSRNLRHFQLLPGLNVVRPY